MLKSISIRRGMIIDFIPLFEWRNHAKVKRGALVKKDLDCKIHYQWLEKHVKAGTLFIVHIDNKALGVVSFTEDYKDSYIWSFYVVPEMQGNGLGMILMEAGILVARNVLKAKRLSGEVEHSNSKSKELHKKLGFMEVVENPTLSVFVKEL